MCRCRAFCVDHVNGTHPEGSTWHPNSCTSCTCDTGGKLSCKETVCSIACNDPLPAKPGTCCPICPIAVSILAKFHLERIDKSILNNFSSLRSFLIFSRRKETVRRMAVIIKAKDGAQCRSSWSQYSPCSAWCSSSIFFTVDSEPVSHPPRLLTPSTLLSTINACQCMTRRCIETRKLYPCKRLFGKPGKTWDILGQTEFTCGGLLVRAGNKRRTKTKAEKCRGEWNHTLLPTTSPNLTFYRSKIPYCRFSIIYK